MLKVIEVNQPQNQLQLSLQFLLPFCHYFWKPFYLFEHINLALFHKAESHKTESLAPGMNGETDPDTQFLILQLLLEDVNETINRFERQSLSRSKTRSISRLGESDADRRVALHMWRSEIERQRVMLVDYQLAITTPKDTQSTKKVSWKQKICVFISSAIRRVANFVKNTMRSIKHTLDPPKPSCSACQEFHSEILRAKCSHFYCKPCLVQMFNHALRHETAMFPPKCCRKPIAGSHVDKMIGSALVQKCKKKEIELNDRDRTYCSNGKCSEYLLPKVSFWGRLMPDTVQTCECGTRTCRRCKQRAHQGKCHYHIDTSLRVLMVRKKWKRCFNCGRVIELRDGCVHIT
jgi:hypothetical protein